MWQNVKKKYIKQTEQVLGIFFAVLIFLIPTNLFKILDEAQGYVNGLQVDYLIPKLYLSDFVILSLAAYFFYVLLKQNKIFTKETLKTYIPILLLILLQLFKTEPAVGILFLFRITLLIFIGITILSNTKLSKILHSKLTKFFLFFTILFQGGIALIQFIKQSSVASYYFLGETNLLAFAGIAKGTWGNYEYILPYGTTAHPNILAGSLSILFLVYLVNFFDRKAKLELIQMLLALLTTGLVIVATQSITAGITLVLGLLLFFVPDQKLSVIKTKALPLSILVILITGFLLAQTDFSSNSLKRRAYLNQAAISAFEHNPIWGVGVQQFPAVVEKYSAVDEVVRFTQPAHNVGLLVLSELGLIGIFLIILTADQLIQTQKNLKFNPKLVLSTIPILALDHYLYTIQTGLLLLWLITLFSLSHHQEE